MSSSAKEKIPHSRQEGYISAALMMRNIVELLRTASDWEKEIIVFTVYFLNISSKKSSNSGSILLMGALKEIMSPSIYKKLHSSVKKFKEIHVRDPLIEEMIDKAFSDMEPV